MLGFIFFIKHFNICRNASFKIEIVSLRIFFIPNINYSNFNALG